MKKRKKKKDRSYGNKRERERKDVIDGEDALSSKQHPFVASAIRGLQGRLCCSGIADGLQV